MSNEFHNMDRSGVRGVQRLVGALLCIAVVWIGVLPWLAKQPTIREHIETMEEQGIEVDAMFYTDLNWQPPTGASWK